MLLVLACIVGIYAAAAAIAHWTITRRRKAGKRHYVLVAGNHEQRIEGYIRALRQSARVSGRDIGITVVLANSFDDTGPIVERLGRESQDVRAFRPGGGEPGAKGAAAAAAGEAGRPDGGEGAASGERGSPEWGGEPVWGGEPRASDEAAIAGQRAATAIRDRAQLHGLRATVPDRAEWFDLDRTEDVSRLRM